MKTNKFGEIIYDQDDLCEVVMQGHDVTGLENVLVDPDVNLEQLIYHLENPGSLATWTFPEASDISVPCYDSSKQCNWFMPEDYKNLDIAEYVLGLCKNPEQLQRCGQELLMFQERDMFDLLRYLKYLVDVMRENHVIWGAGRGSSVASYVLYLLGIHRIDSIYYNLDPSEFLR